MPTGIPTGSGGFINPSDGSDDSDDGGDSGPSDTDPTDDDGPTVDFGGGNIDDSDDGGTDTSPDDSDGSDDSDDGGFTGGGETVDLGGGPVGDDTDTTGTSGETTSPDETTLDEIEGPDGPTDTTDTSDGTTIDTSDGGGGGIGGDTADETVTVGDTEVGASGPGIDPSDPDDPFTGQGVETGDTQFRNPQTGETVSASELERAVLANNPDLRASDIRVTSEGTVEFTTSGEARLRTERRREIQESGERLAILGSAGTNIGTAGIPGVGDPGARGDREGPLVELGDQPTAAGERLNEPVESRDGLVARVERDLERQIGAQKAEALGINNPVLRESVIENTDLREDRDFRVEIEKTRDGPRATAELTDEFRRRFATEIAERQLEQQSGGLDLVPGEDFELVEDDQGRFRPELKSEGRTKIATDPLTQFVEDVEQATGLESPIEGPIASGVGEERFLNVGGELGRQFEEGIRESQTLLDDAFSGGVSIGAQLESATGLDLVTDRRTRGQRVAKGVLATGPLLATESPLLFKNAADVGATGIQAAREDELGEFSRDVGAAAGTAAAIGATGAIRRPFETAGMLGASLVGSSALIRLGGRPAAFAIQPGEEIASAGLTRAFPGVASRFPGGRIDWEEITLRGLQRAGGRARSAIGRTTARPRSAVEGARERAPSVGVERRPGSGLVDVDPRLIEGAISRLNADVSRSSIELRPRERAAAARSRLEGGLQRIQGAGQETRTLVIPDEGEAFLTRRAPRGRPAELERAAGALREAGADVRSRATGARRSAELELMVRGFNARRGLESRIDDIRNVDLERPELDLRDRAIGARRSAGFALAVRGFNLRRGISSRIGSARSRAREAAGAPRRFASELESRIGGFRTGLQFSLAARGFNAQRSFEAAFEDLGRATSIEAPDRSGLELNVGDRLRGLAFTTEARLFNFRRRIEAEGDRIRGLRDLTLTIGEPRRRTLFSIEPEDVDDVTIEIEEGAVELEAEEIDIPSIETETESETGVSDVRARIETERTGTGSDQLVETVSRAESGLEAETGRGEIGRLEGIQEPDLDTGLDPEILDRVGAGATAELDPGAAADETPGAVLAFDRETREVFRFEPRPETEGFSETELVSAIEADERLDTVLEVEAEAEAAVETESAIEIAAEAGAEPFIFRPEGPDRPDQDEPPIPDLGLSTPGEDELAPGWLSETFTDLALAGERSGQELTQAELEELPVERRIVGELPTVEMVEGTEAERAAIMEVEELFGVRDDESN